jgi:2-phosphosulfolactate phosphatase
MKIRLMPRVEDIDEREIAGSNVIVIDVLRATSVIVTALNNGARGVIPVLSPEEAFKVRDRVGESAVLGGERKGVRIEGFDGGNSPLEYTKEFIGGKTLITTTSNGTRAIRGCSGAECIFTGSFLNGRSAAKAAAGLDISIVCAGTLGKFSLDDFLCAGYIIECLLNMNDYELDDISFLAYHTYAGNSSSLESFIKNAAHSRYLTSLGMEKDVYYCLERDAIHIAPIYKDGIITVHP